jgi:hypothetical protein
VAVERLRLPLVPCRSKSGGLHLFLFLSREASAEVVQGALRDMAAQLGHAGAEVFPKQTRLMSERGDAGNWMVMPYYGDTYGGRLREQVGLKKTGSEMDLEEFLRFAERSRADPDALGDITVARGQQSRRQRGEGGPFSDGPPCLQHLARTRVPQGGQNNALLHMGVYFKRAYPNDWKVHLERANQEYLDPPGTAEGVTSVIRSLERKDYEYTCRNEPMASHCDQTLCRTRRHGIGASGNWPKITSLSKLDTDPPIWFVDVDGERIEATTDQLQNYSRFHALCMEKCNRTYLPMKVAEWFIALNEAMANLTVIEAPRDLSADERFREMLEEFLTNRARGQRKEDLLSGRPWEDDEAGRHYFRLRDLTRHLQREGVRDLGRNAVSQMLRRLGGDSDFFNISGKGTSVWWVPSGVVQATPQLPIPDLPGETV